MDKDFELNLKPINKGLGLDHFAEGMPYAPAEKRKNKKDVSNPYRDQAPSLAETINESFADPNELVKKFVEDVQDRPKAPELVEENVEVERTELQVEAPKAASFVWRIGAYMIDFFTASMIYLAVVTGAFLITGYSISSMQSFWPFGLMFMVIYGGYFLVQEVVWKSTLGKSLFRVRIRATSNFSVFVRFFCFFISVLPMGIGLFWYFFDSRKRCWHDVISDTEVVLN